MNRTHTITLKYIFYYFSYKVFETRNISYFRYFLIFLMNFQVFKVNKYIIQCSVLYYNFFIRLAFTLRIYEELIGKTIILRSQKDRLTAIITILIFTSTEKYYANLFLGTVSLYEFFTGIFIKSALFKNVHSIFKTL